ncbi:MAG: hypothetical protein K1X67_04520 [Fimbriimonadaceae bacterium]|nr:hypothetical protein [Fimbriimonadaceae bacterium]
MLLTTLLGTALIVTPLDSSDFVLFESDKYSFEVPRGWSVGKETPWGARDITTKSDSGKFGAMTAGPTQASWDELYQTSLYFIKREGKGKETPYRLGKSKQGYATMSFEVVNPEGFADRRYVLLKAESGLALALSVKIPGKSQEKEYAQMFRHMVDTAKFK